MLLNCLNKRHEWIYALVLWNWHAVDEIKSIPNENLFIKPKMGNHRWKIMIDWLIDWAFSCRKRFFIHGQIVHAHQHHIAEVENTILNNDLCRPHYADHRVVACLYYGRAYYKGQWFEFSLGALEHS